MKYFIILFFCSIILLSKSVNAQWSSDPLVNNPVCVSDGDQSEPKIISDGNGGAIIAWQDYQSGNAVIFTQRIDRYGYVKWLSNGIPVCDTGSDQFNFDMVEDGKGGVIFAWQDNRDSSNKIYIQRIDSSGNYLWSDTGVQVCALNYDQIIPKIVQDGQGKYLITWLDKRSGISNVYAQKIDLDGLIVWNDFGAKATSDLGDVQSYRVKSDGWGGVYIVWEDSVFSTNKLIKAQYLTGTRNRMWGPSGTDLLVSNGISSAQFPNFAISSEDKIIITWSDNRSGVFNIYAQSINRNGTINWDVGGIAVSNSSADQFNPQIVKSNDGSFIVVWEDNRDLFPAIPPKVYTQKLSSFGLKLWQSGDIYVHQSTLDQRSPKIIEDGLGGAHVLWTDFSFEFGNILSKSLNRDGDFLIPSNTIITQAEWTQTLTGITTDGANGLIAVWVDRRNNLINSDVYCAQMDANGNLGAGQGKIGLIADYTFNGNANDISNNNNNGTVVNAVLTIDRFGNSESAYEFNGTAYISVPSSYSLNSPKKELTQSAWIQIYQWGWLGNQFVPVLVKSNVSDYNFQYRLAVSQSALITSINNWDNSSYAQFNPELNTWCFVASVIKDDSVKSYVNANLINTYPLIPGPINYDSKPLEIGRDMPGAEENFFGKIDDVKIYNRALTEVEIQNLFNYGSTTSIQTQDKNLNIPIDYYLSQNYPNPFNPSTTISFSLPNEEFVSLKVFNTLGEEISELVNEISTAGNYEIKFNAAGLSSGVYIYRLQAGNFSMTKKLSLLK